MTFKLNRTFAELIHRTGDPLMPIKLQQAHDNVERLARALIPTVKGEAETREHQEHLLASYPENMNHISGSPEFIVAVCGILCEALVQYGAEAGQ